MGQPARQLEPTESTPTTVAERIRQRAYASGEVCVLTDEEARAVAEAKADPSPWIPNDEFWRSLGVD